MSPAQRKRLYRCSFCGKAQTEVKKLIAGPGVFICDECTGLCSDIVANSESPDPEAAKAFLPENVATEMLLKMLGGYNGASERIDTAMQDMVDILREREVSWAEIGKAMEVSRQAAWKRFG